MKVYLDNCCLMRLSDPQAQARIRVETAAIKAILDLIKGGRLRLVASEVLVNEIQACADLNRQVEALAELRHARETVEKTGEVSARARHLVKLGFRRADALHIASAEIAECDLLLTTDDAFLRNARKPRAGLRVKVANPASAVLEGEYDE